MSVATMVVGEVPSDAANDAEAELVERAKQRSPSAWAEIYDLYYRKLFRYCYARTGSEATAADLASKVYLDALEGIEWYVYRGRPLLAWFYRIARNAVADHYRANEKESRALERIASIRQPYDPGPATEVGDRQDLRAAVEQLTEDQQQVVALRFYAGFTTSEIAHALDRSERAVYSLEVRALAALRRVLAPHGLPEADQWVA